MRAVTPQTSKDREPILGERTGTEQVMSYSELKEEIHAARGLFREKWKTGRLQQRGLNTWCGLKNILSKNCRVPH
ncbi:hypothetical protein AV530_005241 [Patagioenas fasciata monilis]|uniref:Uncharacterized protein n=1 Tax=Patagioenas fasciata monilis TaxID=372326 RepID=A0A1V4JKL7_PATFA|nr:hypothetical protein AV530_005241 [Patagioenas fasciata monilis]